MSKVQSNAPTYNVILDYGDDLEAADVSRDSHWVMAIVPLGWAYTYDRGARGSISTSPEDGIKPRSKTIVITDASSMSIERDKRSHVKTLSASLKQSDHNYLREIRGGDWILAWCVNNKPDYDTLVADIIAGKPCNSAKSGFKFIGRVQSIYRHLSVSNNHRMVSFDLQASGFSELDAALFYDHMIGQADVMQRNVGAWLAKLGKDATEIFNQNVAGVEDNVNVIIPLILDLVVGRGVSANVNPAKKYGFSNLVGGGQEGAPDNAYLVPTEVGSLMGKVRPSAGKHVSYADILSLISGVQNYGTDENNLKAFFPDIEGSESDPQGNRWVTILPISGTFLPFFPDMINRPLWSVLQQYLNKSVNEMYTAMKVSEDGNTILPTLVLRQIPFTTDLFNPKWMHQRPAEDEEKIGNPTGLVSEPTTINATRFLNVPRWVIPGVIIQDMSVGFTDALRCNFVHVYGSALQQAETMTVAMQMSENAPIHDDLDIQRSGVRSYMDMVDCDVGALRHGDPGKWMGLIADWSMGQHLTMNGTVTVKGIQAPIAEGDNAQIGCVVYHIESIHDSCSISMDGIKQWTTTLRLSNGTQVSNNKSTEESWSYPGLTNEDAKALDSWLPGMSGDMVEVEDSDYNPKDQSDDDTNTDTLDRKHSY